MKRILYPLLATAFVLNILLPVGVFAAQDTGALCPVHADKTCFKKDGAYYCGWTEDVSQNKLMSLKKGQLEWVRVNTTRSEGVPCSNPQVVTSTSSTRIFAGPKIGWLTVPAEKETLLCQVCK